MDKLNADGNTIGRLGALAVIGLVVFGVGRICGGGMCPTTQGAACCSYSQSTTLKK
jgi:hypothetical protein